MDSDNQETTKWTREDSCILIGLSHHHLDVTKLYQHCKCNSAGAVVMFSGCTRETSVPEGEYIESTSEQREGNMGHAHTVVNDNENKEGSTTANDTTRHLSVASLTYTSYVALALKTMRSIAEDILSTYRLERIAMMHRLGTVPIGEESVVIVVSAGHRKEAWRAGEEALEQVKKRVEIWKWEVFDGDQKAMNGGGPSVWRSNATDDGIRARQNRAEATRNGKDVTTESEENEADTKERRTAFG